MTCYFSASLLFDSALGLHIEKEASFDLDVHLSVSLSPTSTLKLHLAEGVAVRHDATVAC